MCQKLSKFISFILSTLLILSLSTGCGKKEKFESGNFRYVWNSDPIMLGIKSNTDTFSRDDVTLDLYFGLHDKNKKGDPENNYKRDPDDTALFAIYICPSEYYWDVHNGMEYADYKIIEKHSFIREIYEDDAFSGEYEFTMEYWKGITYNHCEKISIPSHLFEKDEGKLSIRIISFSKKNEEDKYLIIQMSVINIDYELIDKNTVKINFK